MMNVLQAFGSAFRSLLHPRMLVLTIWPMFIALVAWCGLAWFYWDLWSQWLSALLAASDAVAWLQQHGFSGVVRYSVWLLLWLLLAPLILISALLIAALVEMPLIVSFVAARDYPALEKRRGGTVVGSVVNALVAVLVFSALWLATLPLWFTGALAPVLPVVLSAYLNQRLFSYDALSEHASAAEYRAIRKSSRGSRYALGALLALLYYVPLLNLLVPVLSGLAFTHFGLARLAELRESSMAC